MSKSTPAPLEDFISHIKQALNNFHNPTLLGESSPLAAPYFLGSALKTTNHTSGAMQRGKTLQQALLTASHSIWGEALPETPEAVLSAVNAERQQQGKGQRYTWLVLELRYFRQFFQPPKLTFIWEDYLFVSRPQFHRDLQAAINRLGKALLQHLHPAFRSEYPELPTIYVPRPLLVQRCLTTLQAKQVVSLSGAGGTGKTTIGAAVAQHWPNQAIFQYTIRPNFNDQLNGLLFALGHFLQSLGAATLWQQLVADRGIINNADLLMGILRHDLASLAVAPLLCFDDIESLLHDEQPQPHHLQLIAFWRGLKGLVPMLFIGQKPIDWADKHVTIRNLTEPETVALLQQADVQLENSELSRLHTICQGNPRLLILCKVLFQRGETILDLIRRLRQSVAVSVLIPSLQKQLSAKEWVIVQTLAVFRNPVPQTAWPEQIDLVERLIVQQLIHPSKHGGMMLLPALREAIYASTPVEERERYHHVAALVRATYGEYTASAFHYWKADKPSLAIRIWASNQEAEIMRGLGLAALPIFQAISLNRLTKRDQQTLVFIRSGLYRLRGDSEAGVQDLQALHWSANDIASAKAYDFWGAFLEQQGRTEIALEKYDMALAIAEKQLATYPVFLRTRRGMVHVQRRDMPLAWQDAQTARIEAEHMQGIVQERLGNYGEAKAYYQSALELAKALGQESTIASIRHNLGIIALYQANLDMAISELNTSMAYYKKIGNALQLHNIYAHLSALYIQVKEFDLAIEEGQKAYAFFKKVNHVHYLGSTGANLAEAYFELGQFNEAEKFARQVIALEEAQSVPYALFTMGGLAQARGDLAMAERYFVQSLQMAEENEDTFMVAYAQRSLGEVLVMLGRVVPGRDALTTALHLFKKLSIKPEIEPTQTLLDKVDSG